ncbi:MAG: NusG domain II-containing protein, partial [Burkholderiales bacterium]
MAPALIQRGDLAVLLIGLLAVVVLGVHYWSASAGDRVIIKRGGALFLSASLDRPFKVSVPGPLGVTKIEVLQQKARVLSDPGPRQLCVRQGWISRAGEVAICLPNQVSMEIVGRVRAYDSLNY